MTAGAFLTHALFALFLLACSATLTGLMIRVNITDVPNRRSSHDRPTPKSGGLAVAGAFLLGIVILYVAGDNARIAEAKFIAFVGLAAFMALFALIDDLRELPPRAKLAGQLLCASLFVVLVSHMERLALPGAGVVELGVWGYLLSALWLAGFMNAYNFMDGINGIAGGSAVIAALFLAGIALHAGAPFVYLASVVLCAATAGFLVFNFPRARIFLGDTGSQFIAFVFAGLAILGSAEGHKVSVLVVPMLFYPFLYDVTVTLVRRALAGSNVFSAHREHHYQLLVRIGWPHARVSLCYFALSALHGAAAVAMQLGPAGARLWWLLAPLPVYAVITVAVWRAAAKAGLRRPHPQC